MVKIRYINRALSIDEDRITHITKVVIHPTLEGLVEVRFELKGCTKLYKKRELRDVTQEEYQRYIIKKLEDEIV